MNEQERKERAAAQAELQKAVEEAFEEIGNIMHGRSFDVVLSTMVSHIRALIGQTTCPDHLDRVMNMIAEKVTEAAAFRYKRFDAAELEAQAEAQRETIPADQKVVPINGKKVLH